MTSLRPDLAGVAAPRRIAVIGAGYVGIPTAAMLAHFGHHVVAAERDAARRDTLLAGRSPIMEEGIDDVLPELLGSGRLSIVASAADAVRDAEFVFICVATPTDASGRADLREVDDAVAEIAASLSPGVIVVTKSTVPVGTAERVAAGLGRSDVSVASNPEFLREGTALADSFSPDRTIVGSSNPEAARRVGELFAPLNAPLVLTSSRSAELIKYAANGFLSVKLSYANQIAELCDALGADVNDVVAAVTMDPRIGRGSFSPGPGWGGPCLPKDAAAFVAMIEEASVAPTMMTAALQSNLQQVRHVATRAVALSASANPVIAVLGLSFKSGTRDRRHSPALAVTSELVARGATVRAYDPSVREDDDNSDLAALQVTNSPESAVDGTDLVIVLTEWPEFAKLDWSTLASRVRHPRIFDTRSVVDVSRARAAGFEVHRLGRD